MQRQTVLVAIDDDQPLTRYAGLDIEPGPTVIAWAGAREQGIQLHLAPEVAAQKALELLGAALDAQRNDATVGAVQRALQMLETRICADAGNHGGCRTPRSDQCCPQLANSQFHGWAQFRTATPASSFLGR